MGWHPRLRTTGQDHCTDARRTAGSGPLLCLWVVCARDRTRTERFSGAPFDGGLGALWLRCAVQLVVAGVVISGVGDQVGGEGAPNHLREVRGVGPST
jgi:hypothetical protein